MLMLARTLRLMSACVPNSMPADIPYEPLWDDQIQGKFDRKLLQASLVNILTFHTNMSHCMKGSLAD